MDGWTTYVQHFMPPPREGSVIMLLKFVVKVRSDSTYR